MVAILKKGDVSDCNNWRGITLLSMPGKVFCTTFLERLKSELDAILREEQSGFRRGRSCIEQILTLENIIEQTIEYKAQIVLNLIDFRKTFDSVHRDTLWKILKLYGVPEKFITIFKGLYKNSRSCVRTHVGTTDYFNVYSGVRQGFVLSPAFFLIVIDFFMTKAMNLECGIISGNGTLSDLDFADDIALIGKNRQSIQDMTTNLHEYGKKIGLQINAK